MKEFLRIMREDMDREGFTAKDYLAYGLLAPSSGAAALGEAADVRQSASRSERRRSICCCDFSVSRRCAAISSMALLRADERSVEDEAAGAVVESESMEPSPVNNHDLDKPN